MPRPCIKAVEDVYILSYNGGDTPHLLHLLAVMLARREAIIYRDLLLPAHIIRASLASPRPAPPLCSPLNIVSLVAHLHCCPH